MSKIPYRHIVVAGAGTMGTVLTRLFAQAGCTVTLWNHRQPSLDRAAARHRLDLEELAARGRLSEPPETVLARISCSTDWAVFRTADFVIESIMEDLALKHEFFRTVCGLVSPDTVLTTNTSGLRVTDIAAAVTEPGRFCGMHWWNPPDLIPLIEITKGEQTRQETAEAVRDMALALEKRPVIVQKDILGIIGNRLQYAVLREAMHILSLGAAGPAEVDAAMKYGPGFRYSILGPLETADLGGLNINHAVSHYLYPDLGTEPVSRPLEDLVAQGKLGVKTGSGFYDYPEGAGQEKIRWRNALFEKQWALLKDEGGL